MAMKIVTKLLANRLQEKIIMLLHQNQYEFIKSRTIQYCISWTFEYLHKSKKKIIILKLDFQKAFDMIEYSSIMVVIKHMRLEINGSPGLTSYVTLQQEQ
jgi:inorganic pyrophosphatase/exopolyphosphatase